MPLARHISHLRVAIKENIPLLRVNRNAPSTDGLRIEGPLAFIMSVLSSQLNFTYNLLEPSDRQAGMKMKDGNWTGSLGLVHRNHADFYLGTVAVTLSRTEVLDFTSTFIRFQRMFLVGPLENTNSGYFGFFMAFSIDVFAYFFLTFQVLVLLLCFFGLVTKEVRLKSILGNQYILLQILLAEAVNESRFRISSPRRLVWLAWMVFSLFFGLFFSGYLVSIMSVLEKDKFIERIDDFLNYPQVWPVIKAGQVDVDIIKNTRGPAFEEVQKRLMDKENPLGILKSKAIFDSPKVLNMINKGQAAFGSNLLNFKLLLDKRGEHLGTNSCHFYLSDSYAYTVNALGFRKGFDPAFLNLVSDRLQRIVSVGLSYYIYPPPLNHYERCLHRPKSKQYYSDLKLRDFAGPFITLVVALCSSTIVVTLEITLSAIWTKLKNIYKSYRRSKQLYTSSINYF